MLQAFEGGEVREQIGADRRMGHPPTAASINLDDRFITEGVIPEMRDGKHRGRFVSPPQ